MKYVFLSIKHTIINYKFDITLKANYSDIYISN